MLSAKIAALFRRPKPAAEAALDRLLDAPAWPNAAARLPQAGRPETRQITVWPQPLLWPGSG